MNKKICDYCGKDVEEKDLIFIKKKNSLKNSYDEHILTLQVNHYTENSNEIKDICLECAIKYLQKILKNEIDVEITKVLWDLNWADAEEKVLNFTKENKNEENNTETH